MATKLSRLLRHPVVMLVVLVAVALVAARFGHGRGPVGLWDGPI